MKNILFDLDGTIINSEEGITNCIRYVLDFWGMEQPPQEELLCFIGPPLKESFQKKYGFDEEKAIQSVVKYRERFDREGIFECELYAGVAELIQELHGKGYHLAVASSKPETACQRIIEHFHLETYFDGVYGATLDGSISTKKQVLEHVFKENGMKREDTILIGDTKFDAIGAKEAEIPCIGVTYGFGTAEELKEAGAVFICDSTKEVADYIETL